MVTKQWPDGPYVPGNPNKPGRKPKKPKRWVQDWMGKHDVVLSDAAYKALVRKLKAKDQ